MTKKYMPCPCDSKLMFHKCCKTYHDGERPETAEKLMRSRYAAFALGLADYIVVTTHRENSSFTEDRDEWKRDTLHFSQNTKFQSLQILSKEDITPDEAYVTFRAGLMQHGSDASFTERSKFLREDGRWLYHSGVIDG